MVVSPLSLHQSTEPTYSFNRRSVLPLKRDTLWLLETGVVRALTVSEEGNSIILGLWGSGDVVGKVLSNPHSAL